MTQKEFKLSLQRGQGRALQAVRDNPAKYYKSVLWACARNLSFDTQCEGTRSWYVYQMTNCFEDKAAFVQAAVDRLETTKLWNYWQLLYLSELLFLLSEDGYSSAVSVLWDKYENLYKKLLDIKHPPKRFFWACDSFEMLSLVLAHDKTTVVKIANDIGKLYENQKVFDGSDFSWLHISKIKRFKAALKKQAKTSQDIQRYLQVSNDDELRWDGACSNPPSDEPNKPKTGLALSFWLERKADMQTILQYAKAYIDTTEPQSRADALYAFCRCPYPDDPQPIIEDTVSNCEELRNIAWEALENIRHPKVRDFALNHLKDNNGNAVIILIKNYLPKDERLLEKLIKQIPVDYMNKTGWHRIHLDVLAMTDNGIKAPTSLLKHIYHTTFCSVCREYALRQMVKRRIASVDTLKECLLDSNQDIRIYAEKLLKKRRKPNETT